MTLYRLTAERYRPGEGFVPVTVALVLGHEQAAKTLRDLERTADRVRREKA